MGDRVCPKVPDIQGAFSSTRGAQTQASSVKRVPSLLHPEAAPDGCLDRASPRAGPGRAGRAARSQGWRQVGSPWEAPAVTLSAGSWKRSAPLTVPPSVLRSALVCACRLALELCHLPGEISLTNLVTERQVHLWASQLIWK